MEVFWTNRTRSKNKLEIQIGNANAILFKIRQTSPPAGAGGAAAEGVRGISLGSNRTSQHPAGQGGGPLLRSNGGGGGGVYSPEVQVIGLVL